MIQSRGYSTKRYSTLDTAYFNEPTELQRASYDKHLLALVREDNIHEFCALFARGLSPNPVEDCGESLLHTICRSGAQDFLLVLVEFGCDLQAVDRFGRTAVHEVCFSKKPNFGIVKILLETDPRMMVLTDCRGATPLSYVPKNRWAAWLQFLESVKDEYWPLRDAKHSEPQGPPERALAPCNSRPVANPHIPISLEEARNMASGSAI
jgi:hypothetical protein